METSRRIWWLASYPKSGNTWVRMFVNAYVTGFPVDLNSAYQYASGDLQPRMYQLTAAVPIDRMIDPDPIYYRPAVLLNFLHTSASRDIVLKTHHAKVECDGIPLIPPRLSKGALYIVRDPRDVVSSFADHCGFSIDESIEAMGRNEQTLTKNDSSLYHVLLSWSAHVDSWTVNNRDVPTSVVRYEDMVSDTEATFKKILMALGLEYDEGRFHFAMEQAEFSRLKAKEEAKGFREAGKGGTFFREGKSGRWRDVLTGEQVKKIESAHRETMRRWGYLSSERNKLGKVVSAASGTVR